MASLPKKVASVPSHVFNPKLVNFNTADVTGRFALDQLLRDSGYVILSRPRKGPATWVDSKGNTFTQEIALSLLDPSKVELASYSQQLYYRQGYGENGETPRKFARKRKQ